jgi:glycosyltransferase involved in cell wall biosynthesis
MKILLIHNYYRHSGGEDGVFRAEHNILQHNGNTVNVFEKENDSIKGVNKLFLPLHAIWSRNSQKELRALLLKNKPDIAHFHNTFLLISPAAYYTCQDMNIPVVQTLHNYRLLCPAATLYRKNSVCEKCISRTPPYPGIVHGCWRGSRLLSAIPALMLTVHNILKTWHKQVDVYIALTEFAKRKFVEGGLPEAKILVKPNFVYPDPGAGNGEGNYALFVGRLSEEKGVKTLIQSWEFLPQFTLKIAGDGPFYNELKLYIANHFISSIELLGSQDHQSILSLIKGARFLVFPSEWYEGFPMTIAEAFACGVPVIASRLGAMEEIIKDGRTGLHFNPGDPEDLAAKVEWAWSNPERMREMGNEARREYELKYTAEKNYEMLMEIYRKAIEINKMRR